MRYRRAVARVTDAGPSRPAMAAAVFIAALGLTSFVLLVVVASIREQVSPLQAIFGPLPGAPLIAWLLLVLVATGVQAAVALALRASGGGVLILGIVAALAIAALCAAWLGAVVVDAVRWADTGRAPGDAGDMVGVFVLGLPLALVTLILDLRAALRGVALVRHG